MTAGIGCDPTELHPELVKMNEIYGWVEVFTYAWEDFFRY